MSRTFLLPSDIAFKWVSTEDKAEITVGDHLVEAIKKEERDRLLKLLDEDGYLFQALGDVAMAWSQIPSGVFDAERAVKIGNDLLALLRGSTDA